jgi:hypothetical protein
MDVIEEYKKKLVELYESKLGASETVLKIINMYEEALKNYILTKHNYKKGDDVFLEKGTFLHGTYKNYEGLEFIKQQGFVSAEFVGGRSGKYPGCVGVWNIRDNILLRDYINYYSGGTIRYNTFEDDKTKTAIIPYDSMKDINAIIKESGYPRWIMEQTKEARFMPSLIQSAVQVAFIINTNNEYMQELLKYDILNSCYKENLEAFVLPRYYSSFLESRENKDDFFTDRESAIIFGFPYVFIEGVLVGNIYEKDKKMLDKIKKQMPNAYICNLKGKIIRV